MFERILTEPLVRLVCLLGLYVGPLVGYVVFLRRDPILFAPFVRFLPAPPGAVPETGRRARGAEPPRHSRVYDVERPYQEVAGFFKAELPRLGWRLVEEDTHVTPGTRSPEGIASVELVFRGPYIIPLWMGVRVMAGLHAGIQTGRTRVGINDTNLSGTSRAAHL